MPENFYDIKKYIKMRNPFNHMTIFFKKDLALKYGGYPDLFSKEDYGLWAFFVAHKRKVINLNKPLVKATTDENFYTVRRGGWKYLKSEFNLAKHLLSLKINNIYESIFFLLIRVIFILTFPKLKKILYLKLLRSNNISKIYIGSNTCISQGVYLCSGSHDFRRETFDLIEKEIHIGNHCWISAMNFIPPGTKISDNTFVKFNKFNK